MAEDGKEERTQPKNKSIGHYLLGKNIGEGTCAATVVHATLSVGWWVGRSG